MTIETPSGLEENSGGLDHLAPRPEIVRWIVGISLAKSMGNYFAESRIAVAARTAAEHLSHMAHGTPGLDMVRRLFFMTRDALTRKGMHYHPLDLSLHDEILPEKCSLGIDFSFHQNENGEVMRFGHVSMDVPPIGPIQEAIETGFVGAIIDVMATTDCHGIYVPNTPLWRKIFSGNPETPLPDVPLKDRILFIDLDNPAIQAGLKRQPFAIDLDAVRKKAPLRRAGCELRNDPPALQGHNTN